jgi:hypothetical protein
MTEDRDRDKQRPRNDDNEGNYSFYWESYYSKNRDCILEKKKIYNQRNKKHIAEYHARYYEDHKEELNRKNKERYRNRKIRSR